MTSVGAVIDLLDSQTRTTAIHAEYQTLCDRYHQLSLINVDSIDAEFQHVVTLLTSSGRLVTFETQFCPISFCLEAPLLDLAPARPRLEQQVVNVTTDNGQSREPAVVIIKPEYPLAVPIAAMPLGQLYVEEKRCPWFAMWDIKGQRVFCVCEQWNTEEDAIV